MKTEKKVNERIKFKINNVISHVSVDLVVSLYLIDRFHVLKNSFRFDFN